MVGIGADSIATGRVCEVCYGIGRGAFDGNVWLCPYARPQFFVCLGVDILAYGVHSLAARDGFGIGLSGFFPDAIPRGHVGLFPFGRSLCGCFLRDGHEVCGGDGRRDRVRNVARLAPDSLHQYCTGFSRV